MYCKYQIIRAFICDSVQRCSDATPVVNMLYGIGNKVEIDFLHFLGVYRHIVVGVFADEAETYFFPVEIVVYQIIKACYECSQVCIRICYRHFPVLYGTEFKNLIDEGKQARCISVDDLQGILHFRLETIILKQFLNRTENQSQRRLEFVGYVGEEYQFCIGCFFKLL